MSNNNTSPLSNVWKELIKDFNCDKCKCKFIGSELIFTNYTNYFCDECFNYSKHNENEKYFVMSSRKAMENYCETNIKHISMIMGFKNILNLNDYNSNTI